MSNTKKTTKKTRNQKMAEKIERLKNLLNFYSLCDKNIHTFQILRLAELNGIKWTFAYKVVKDYRMTTNKGYYDLSEFKIENFNKEKYEFVKCNIDENADLTEMIKHFHIEFYGNKYKTKLELKNEIHQHSIKLNNIVFDWQTDIENYCKKQYNKKIRHYVIEDITEAKNDKKVEIEVDPNKAKKGKFKKVDKVDIELDGENIQVEMIEFIEPKIISTNEKLFELREKKSLNDIPGFLLPSDFNLPTKDLLIKLLTNNPCSTKDIKDTLFSKNNKTIENTLYKLRKSGKIITENGINKLV